MNIREKTDDLIDFLKNSLPVHVRFGAIDVGAGELPVINLRPSDRPLNFRHTTHAYTIDFPLSVVFIGSKTDENSVFDLVDAFLKKIGQYDTKSGHYLSEDATMEYGDNQFMVAFTFFLKILNQSEA